MKKALLLLVAPLLLFFVSCSEQKTKTVEEKFEDGSVKARTTYLIEDTSEVKLSRIEYYENGNKKIEGKFEGGKRHGTWKYWYENGNLWSIGEYDKGLREGKSVVFYSDGGIRYEGIYKGNDKTGIWKFYNEHGELIKEKDFDKEPSPEKESNK